MYSPGTSVIFPSPLRPRPTKIGAKRLGSRAGASVGRWLGQAAATAGGVTQEVSRLQGCGYCERRREEQVSRWLGCGYCERSCAEHVSRWVGLQLLLAAARSSGGRVYGKRPPVRPHVA